METRLLVYFSTCLLSYLVYLFPCIPVYLLFDPRMQETLYELPLKDEKEDEERGNDDDGAGGHERPLRANLAALGEHGESNCEWAAVLAVGDDQRPEEIIPVKAHRCECKGNQRGTTRRHINVPEGLQPVRPVHPRGIVEIAWNRFEGLTHQKSPQRRPKVGEHDRKLRIKEVQRANSGKVRHDECARRNHELKEDEEKKYILPPKAIARKRIAREADRHQLHDEDAKGNDDGVQVINAKRRELERRDIVLEREIRAEPNVARAQSFLRRMHGNSERPQDGHRPSQGNNAEQEQQQAIRQLFFHVKARIQDIAQSMRVCV